MVKEARKTVLRMRMRHAPGKHDQPDMADGARLVAAQSLPTALLASLVAIGLFCVFWVAISDLFGRVFPWLTVALGFLVGSAVRRGGLGIDWRFPLLAAVMTVIGSLFALIVLAASYTASDLNTNVFKVLWNVTANTWPVFFAEVVNIADVVYALSGAALAAFLANRRLSRSEYHAVRVWKEGHSRVEG